MQEQIVLKTVPFTSITFGDRFREDLGNISELVESMKKEGIISPLAVVDNSDGTYLLLAGGRRYTAAEKAGITDIPVRCYPPSLSEQERRSIELMENICRKDLGWDEKAKLSKKIYELQIEIHGKKVSTSVDAKGVSIRDVANMIGKSHPALIKDIQRADALKIFPEIAKAKNASDADKMIGKLQEQMLQAELAKRIKNKTADTPIEKLQERLHNQFMIEDFFTGVKGIPGKTINFIEVDPPYAIRLNQQKRDMTTAYTDNYNEVTAEEYPAFLHKLIGECERVMSDNSWMVFWHAKEWRALIKSILTEFNLSYDEGIWYKGNMGQTNSPDRHLASSFEPFLYISKGQPSIIRQGRSNVFFYKPVLNKIHPTERPIELIQDIMQTFCWEGSSVLIPFLGSGNSILAANNLGLTAFGWELSKAYKDSYTVRVSQGKPGAYRSYKEVL